MELYWNSDGAFKHRRADADLVKKLYHSFVVPTEERVLETSRNLPASQLHILIRNDERRPFITSGGHLGLGLSAMLPGDKIAVLFGAELPFIRRQDDEGYYQIIGEAYVHGIWMVRSWLWDSRQNRLTFDETNNSISDIRT